VLFKQLISHFQTLTNFFIEQTWTWWGIWFEKSRLIHANTSPAKKAQKRSKISAHREEGLWLFPIPTRRPRISSFESRQKTRRENTEPALSLALIAQALRSAYIYISLVPSCLNADHVFPALAPGAGKDLSNWENYSWRSGESESNPLRGSWLGGLPSGHFGRHAITGYVYEWAISSVWYSTARGLS
jgi:hypothetical protein